MKLLTLKLFSMKNESYSIKAVLRTDKKRQDGMSPIYLFINSGGETQKLSLSEYIPLQAWDREKERVNGKGYGSLNTIISKKKLDVEKFIRDNAANDIEVTKKDISNFWNKRGDKAVDFYDFYSSFCDNLFKEIKPSTQTHYLTLKKKLEAFSPKLKFKDIDYEFSVKFRNYLEETGSGRFNMIKCYKVALREAMKLKYLIDDSALYIENKSPEGKKVYLLPEEIKAIVKCDLSNYESEFIEIVRELFLFSCYTGLRYSDVMNFKKNSYTEGMIRITQVKTGNFQETPVSTNAKKIMARYIVNTKPEECLFPFVCNQTFNANLKRIAEAAKIDKNLTSHVGRHTFGTILQMNGVNGFDICRLMGHKKLDQTYMYAHSVIESLKSIIKNVAF